jgi:hypothetical protein
VERDDEVLPLATAGAAIVEWRRHGAALLFSANGSPNVDSGGRRRYRQHGASWQCPVLVITEEPGDWAHDAMVMRRRR